MGNREKPGSTPKATPCKPEALVPVAGPVGPLSGPCGVEPITPALLLRKMSVVTVLLLLLLRDHFQQWTNLAGHPAVLVDHPP